MENKQTAIDWFYDQIIKNYWDYMTFEQQNRLFDQAKQMEKEQIIEANKAGFAEAIGLMPNQEVVTPEQYYNEIYGKINNTKERDGEAS